jgi:hypothetical protein
MDYIFNSVIGLGEKKTDELYIKFHRDSDYFLKIIDNKSKSNIIDYFRDDFDDNTSISSGDIYLNKDDAFGYIVNEKDNSDEDNSDEDNSDEDNSDSREDDSDTESIGDMTRLDSDEFDSDIKEFIGETIIDYNMRMNIRYYGFVRK